MAEIAAQFTLSPERLAVYGTAAPADVIRNLLTALGNTDAAEISNWSTQLTEAQTATARGQVFVDLIAAIQHWSGTGLAAAQKFDNQVALGLTYAAVLGGNGGGGSQLRTIMQKVTAQDNAIATKLAIASVRTDIIEQTPTQIAQIYLALYQRAPDPQNLGYWIAKMAGGMSPAQVAQFIWDSPEALALQPNSGDSSADAASIVNSIIPGSIPAGKDAWIARLAAAPHAQQGAILADLLFNVSVYQGLDAGELASRQQLSKQVAASLLYATGKGNDASLQQQSASQPDLANTVDRLIPAFLLGALSPNADPAAIALQRANKIELMHRVTQLYLTLFGRAPDQPGLQYWLGKAIEQMQAVLPTALDTPSGDLPAGLADKALATVAQGMMNSSEWQNNALFLNGGQTNALIIYAAYNNALKHSPNDAEAARWVSALESVDPTATAPDTFTSTGAVLVKLIATLAAGSSADTDPATAATAATAATDTALLNNKTTVALAYACLFYDNSNSDASHTASSTTAAQTLAQVSASDTATAIIALTRSVTNALVKEELNLGMRLSINDHPVDPAALTDTNATGATSIRTGMSVDRWGNTLSVTDPRDDWHTSRYRYNANNQRLSAEKVSIEGIDGNAIVASTSVGAANSYDLQGHLTAVVEGNTVQQQGNTITRTEGNRNRMQYDRLGNMVREIHADGGTVDITYDAFGQRTSTTTERTAGNVQDNMAASVEHSSVRSSTTYDHLGHVTSTTSAKVAVAKVKLGGGNNRDVTLDTDADAAGGIGNIDRIASYYRYDQLGRRIADIDSGGMVHLTQYNANNDIIASTDSRVYDLTATQTTTASAEQTAIALADSFIPGMSNSTIAGLQQQQQPRVMASKVTNQPRTDTATGLPLAVTTIRRSYDAFHHKTSETEADGHSMTWQVNAFGQIASHTNMSGLISSYTYDKAGQILSEGLGTSTAASLASGNITIRYTWHNGQLTGVFDNTVPDMATYTTSSYDKAGAHLSDKTIAYVNHTSNRQAILTGTLTAQDNHIVYDAMGRISSVDDARYHIEYEYDAHGNRTHIITRYTEDGIFGKDIVSEVWNAYDSMNRQTIVDGVKDAISGEIGINDKQGHRITYDTAGNRISDTWYGQRIISISGTTGNGNHTIGPNGPNAPTNTSNAPETFTNYSSVADYTTAHFQYDAANRLIGIYRDGILIDSRQYDAADHVVASGYALGLSAGQHAIPDIDGQTRTNSYDMQGRLQFQTVRDAFGRRVLKMHNTYDLNGNLVTNLNTEISGDNSGNNGQDSGGNILLVDVTYQYTTQYDERDQVAKVVGQQGSNTASSTVYDIDLKGRLIGTHTPPVDPGINGHGISTDNGNQRILINDTQGRILYNNLSGTATHTLIVNGEVLGESSDNRTPGSFNVSYTPVADSANTANINTGSYTVQENGQSLQSIAKAIWGDATQWYMLAEANGINDSTVLTAGQSIRIPERSSSIHNDYQTYQPYNANHAIGDASPDLTLPPPPIDDGGTCGMMKQLVVMVVTVVVAYYTGVWLGELGAGTFVAGAIGGAVGSVVGQETGIALGVQDKLDWNQVGLSAIGGGISGGMQGATFGTTDAVANGFIRGAISSTLTQGIGVATGLQKKFNWMGVAAAAAGGAVSAGVNQSNFNDAEFVNSFNGDMHAARIASGIMAGFASGLTASVLHGGKVTIAQVMVDSFGQGLTSGVMEAMQPQDALGDFISLHSKEWNAIPVGNSAIRLSNGVEISDADMERASNNGEKFVQAKLTRKHGKTPIFDLSGAPASFDASSLSSLKDDVGAWNDNIMPQVAASSNDSRVSSGAISAAVPDPRLGITELSSGEMIGGPTIANARNLPGGYSGDNGISGFMQGYGNSEKFHGVLDREETFSEMMGHYAGNITHSFSNVVSDMTGATDAKAASLDWSRGDYISSTLHEMRAVGNAGLTILSLGTTSAVKTAFIMSAEELLAVRSTYAVTDSLAESTGGTLAGMNRLEMAGANSPTFRVASKSGLEFESTITSRTDSLTTIDFSTKQRILKDGSIVNRSYESSYIYTTFDETTGHLFIDKMGAQPGNYIGREMISNVIETIGPQKIRTIGAEFADTNLQVFNGLMGEGMTATNAAKNTPFGKALRDLGYDSHLKFVDPIAYPRPAVKYVIESN